MFIDTALIRLFQWSYDKVWDRFGVYKGQVIQLFAVIAFVVELSAYFADKSSNHILGFIITALNFSLSVPLNLQQNKKQYIIMNKFALRMRDGFYPVFMRFIIVALLILMTTRFIVGIAPLESITTGVSILVWQYLSCVCVRDREPPESMSLSFNPT